MDSFVLDHPNLNLVQACLANVPLHMFWSISDQYPDLVCSLHVQVRLVGNFVINEGTQQIQMKIFALNVEEILRL